MFRKRFKRRYIYVTVIISFGCLFFVNFFAQTEDFQDNKSKIQIIERSINTDENQGECRIPDLPINNSEILKFYTKVSKIDCGNDDEDWITCERSQCYVKPSILESKGPVTCSYTDLIRKSDFSVRHGKTTRTNSYYVLNQSDFAKVYCKSNDGDRWYGLAIGIRNSTKIDNELPSKSLLNVLMLGFDSLSRNAFIRKLPKTYEFITKELEAIVLKGYNIVGDGTPQALIPILTGYTELELPETRKRMKKTNYVDIYPMIWKEYKNNGYITSFNEDIPNYGTFTYRLNGFKEQPTDHYMRTFYVEVENFLTSSKKYCVGHEPGHKVMLDYTKNFVFKYNTKFPTFAFSFHGELSHDSINLIEAADDDIKEWILDLQRASVLNNTILILMSDHGNRFAEVRNTLQGKQEERLPFFSFIFPGWFKKKHTTEYKNLLQNTERLTTPFDIHETLRDILRIQSLNVKNNNFNKVEKNKSSLSLSRAISLFNEIPKSRSCADAYIEPHWCACLNWIQINDTNSKLAYNIAESVLNVINDATSIKRSVCEKLNLDEINWLMKLQPHNKLLKFKQNKDTDGYLADLTSKTNISSELYQIKLTVQPGKSIFEASVRYNIKMNSMSLLLSDISRVNKYGSQANCIYDTDPELRKYCYCKNL